MRDGSAHERHVRVEEFRMLKVLAQLWQRINCGKQWLEWAGTEVDTHSMVTAHRFKAARGAEQWRKKCQVHQVCRAVQGTARMHWCKNAVDITRKQWERCRVTPGQGQSSLGHLDSRHERDRGDAIGAMW